MNDLCGGAFCSSSRPPPSTKGAHHHSLGFQPQVPRQWKTEASAVGASHARCTHATPRARPVSSPAQMKRAYSAFPDFGRGRLLGFAPQAMMNRACGAHDGLWDGVKWSGGRWMMAGCFAFLHRFRHAAGAEISRHGGNPSRTNSSVTPDLCGLVETPRRSRMP